VLVLEGGGATEAPLPTVTKVLPHCSLIKILQIQQLGMFCNANPHRSHNHSCPKQGKGITVSFPDVVSSTRL